jgi:KaiC/GvpD/RAD55 family RecA-like ATPase
MDKRPTQFIAEGIRQGEPGIVAVFEERPQAYAERAASLGLDLETPQKDGKLTILYLRPLDLSVDETMHSILDAVQRLAPSAWSSIRWPVLKWLCRQASAPTFANRSTA